MRGSWIVARCMLRMVVVIGVALVCAGAGLCQRKNKKAALPAYSIVFDRLSLHRSQRFPSVDVFVMKMNKKHARALTTNHLSHNPAWSRDGRTVAYLGELHVPAAKDTLYGDDYSTFLQYREYMGMSREVFTIDADGGTPTHIASVGRDARDVFWFPDGARIGVRATDVGARRVMLDTIGGRIVLDPKDMKEENLKAYFSRKTAQPQGACLGGYNCLVEWIPPVDNFQPVYIASVEFEYGAIYFGGHFIHFGSYLAKVPSSADYTRYLGVVTLDGKAEDFPPGAYDLAWSPDAKFVAYSEFIKSDYAVLHTAPVIDGRVGEGDRTLTEQGLDAHGPVWSPDGTRIAFMGLWKDSSQIFIVGVDGKGLSQISHNAKLSCYHPSWSPDGKWMVAACEDNRTPVRALDEDFQGFSKIYLFDLSDPKAKPRSLTTCAPEPPEEVDACGDSNPSFAPVATGAQVQ